MADPKRLWVASDALFVDDSVRHVESAAEICEALETIQVKEGDSKTTYIDIFVYIHTSYIHIYMLYIYVIFNINLYKLYLGNSM